MKIKLIRSIPLEKLFNALSSSDSSKVEICDGYGKITYGIMSGIGWQVRGSYTNPDRPLPRSTVKTINEDMIFMCGTLRVLLTLGVTEMVLEDDDAKRYAYIMNKLVVSGMVSK